MISVLSLVVAILAVFFGPLVTWEVARQQIRGAARERRAAARQLYRTGVT